MRKQTLGVIFIVMTFLLIFFFKPLIRSYPFFFIFYILLLIALIMFNQRIRAWRKARGRDIEEEEKYENVETGIISLRPHESNNDDISYRL